MHERSRFSAFLPGKGRSGKPCFSRTTAKRSQPVKETGRTVDPGFCPKTFLTKNGKAPLFRCWQHAKIGNRSAEAMPKKRGVCGREAAFVSHKNFSKIKIWEKIRRKETRKR
ncbi:MAG: hypothetical protein C6W57_07955 [Caldibacillus debilis]|nr:hypothetical protein [Bacillaceae bacterium]REJ16875.1 MAG: hypothetical protein C6W57_07955 [Caldibacillus debilis]